LNFTGAVKQSFSFSEGEGTFKQMNRNGNYIIFFTSNNYFRIFDMSHRKYKQFGRSRKFEDNSGVIG
jgi:hypothetical protein